MLDEVNFLLAGLVSSMFKLLTDKGVKVLGIFLHASVIFVVKTDQKEGHDDSNKKQRSDYQHENAKDFLAFRAVHCSSNTHTRTGLLWIYDDDSLHHVSNDSIVEITQGLTRSDDLGRLNLVKCGGAAITGPLDSLRRKPLSVT